MSRKPKTRAESKMSTTTLTMLIDFYLGSMQRRGCTPDSVISCQRALHRFHRHLTDGGKSGDTVKLSHLTRERLNAYVYHLQNRTNKWEGHPHKPVEQAKLSPFTICKEVKILRGFGTWLEGEGFSNPFDELEVPKVPRYVVEVLTPAEIEQLLTTINPGTELGARQYAIVMLMLDTGLRISEVAEARISNLNMERRQLKVMGKGQKERIVPFGQRCAQALMRYVHMHRAKPRREEFNHIFLAPDGEPMTRNSLEQVVRRLRIASGISRLHAHLMRHTFAVNYLINGGDLRTLQLILGHESLVVTQRYLHLSQQLVQARYENSSPMDKLTLNSERRFGSRKARRASAQPV